MKIKIICVGKTKKDYWVVAEKDLAKRILSSAKLEWVYVEEEKVKQTVKSEEVKNREGKKIIQSMDKSFYNVLLDVEGTMLSSHDFAGLIEDVKDKQGGKLCFIIGGPLGVSAEVKIKSDLVISFSKMTFTHDLIRILLLEQIFRGYEIIKGSGYHK